MKNCQVCNKEFEPKMSIETYCRRECRKAAEIIRQTRYREERRAKLIDHVKV